MGAVSIPIRIIYDTQGATPVSDVIAALRSAETLIVDAVSLVPSLVPGARVELRGVSVQKLSQESPLHEILLAAVWVTAQKDLEEGVVGSVEHLFGVAVDPKYETLLTLVTLVVLFQGVALARKVVERVVTEGPAKRKLEGLVADLASSTGHSPEEVQRILNAKYDKPGPVKTVAKAAVCFFLPSMREGARAVSVNGDRIEPQVVGDIPMVHQIEKDEDFRRFEPHTNVELHIHAQDIDKSAVGWAAVPVAITEKRLKLRLVEPVHPEEVWGKSVVHGDIVLISELTAEGYKPREIQLTSVNAAE
jgi:hypothetical protein